MTDLTDKVVLITGASQGIGKAAAQAFAAKGAKVALAARTVQHFGRLDVLVNNAGRGMRSSVATASLQDYRDLLELNVVSVVNAIGQAVPHMQAQGGGHIVNVSSGTTLMPIPGMALYSSTKHALNNLSDIARLELAPHGIRVSTVYPTITATNFGQNAVGATPQTAGSYGAGDTPESVAALMVQAVEEELDEVFAPALRKNHKE